VKGRAPRILVVDDEQNLAEGIRENLELEGFSVDLSHAGNDALGRILDEDYDLVVLDVMMPELDGWEICARARAAGADVPVLFLTARGNTDDRVRGFEAGGDDYLAKPFQLRELLLRVAAILRRRGWPGAGEVAGLARFEFGGNSIDFRAGTAKGWDGRDHVLSYRESQALHVLAKRHGALVSREELLETIWGNEVYPSTKAVDHLIARLRARLEKDPLAPRHFHTIRGVGYRFTADPEDS